MPAALRARLLVNLACVLAVAATMLTPLPLHGLLNASTWRPDDRARQVRLALARIPDNAVVAADNRLAPQLTTRCTVYFFPGYPDFSGSPQDNIRPDWVAVSNPPDTTMVAPITMTTAIDRLPAYGYRMVLRTNDILIYRRPSNPATP